MVFDVQCFQLVRRNKVANLNDDEGFDKGLDKKTLSASEYVKEIA